MAAAALAVEDVGRQAADLRQAAEREQEVAGPAVVDAHAAQLREDTLELGSDHRLDARRVACAVDHAAAEQQASVGAQPEVVEQVVAVLDAEVAGQQLKRPRAERLGGDHLRAAGHGARGQPRLQVAEVGVAGQQHLVGLDHALRGVHAHARAALDARDLRLLVDPPAAALEGQGLALRQAQRVHMTAARIEQRAEVALAGHLAAHGLAVEHLQALQAVTLPEPLVRFQAAQLAWGEGGEQAAVLELAIDGVARHQLAQDAAALEGHGAHGGGLCGAVARLDDVEVARVAVDDLPAIAPRSPPADPRLLQQQHAAAGVLQVQRGAQPGVAGADHADVGTHAAGQGRAGRLWQSGGGVVRGRVTAEVVLLSHRADRCGSRSSSARSPCRRRAGSCRARCRFAGSRRRARSCRRRRTG